MKRFAVKSLLVCQMILLLGTVYTQAQPANDNCANAEPVGEVTNQPFDTTSATFDGTGSCMYSPNIWYCYTATDSGSVTVSLCGSSYDTMLAVYEGCSCGPLGANIACEDDYYDCGLSSQATFDAIEGNTYLIEVGGWSSHTGQGVLSISTPGDWKADANDRIELYRKGDFLITAVWPYGSKPPIPDVTVEISQTEHHFAFGSALAHTPLSSNSSYRNFVLDHFEWAVCENESKWAHNEPSRDYEDYEQADYIYNWCANNGITMRGHCLFWAADSQVQNWVKALDYKTYPQDSNLLTEVYERIDSGMNHFKGKFVHWDINNEMCNNSFYADRLGYAVRPWMFQSANAIDPNCMLFVNDYGVIAGGYNLYNYKQQIYGLLDDGAPVHGIGVQCHFWESSIDPCAIYSRFESLAEVGLPIWCSEYDFAAEDEYVRADGLEKFYRTAFSHPAVEGILMWGFWEDSHWRDNCHIVNSNWSLNAAGRKYEDLLDEWTTNDSSITDSNGNADFRGFYGKYRVILTSPDEELADVTIDVIPGGPNEFTIELSPPPAAPTNLTATPVSEKVLLDWDDNNEPALDGYNVYRSTTQGDDYSQINSTLLSDSNYTDDTVIAGTTYYYVVKAVDTFSRESGYSNEDSATAFDITPPAAPTGLTTSAGNEMVLLFWNDNTEDDVNGYDVYRSTTSGSEYSRQNVSLLSNPEYTDNSVINGVTYYYVVTAVDTSSNESEYSNQASATPALPIIYNFVGVTGPNTNYNAYACDVDVFPFYDNAANRNSMVEATDSQYVNISADDAAEWAISAPGVGDETFIWVEMKINEPPSSISQIELTFNGYTGGSATPHGIYVMIAGADWTANSSWVQVGSNESIPGGVDTTMTRLITSDISTYIDGTGKIVWGVHETTSNVVMHINYLETAVCVPTNYPPAAPTGLVATAGNGLVSLDWNDNNEVDLESYNVYRSTDQGGGYDQINVSPVTDSNYVDNDVNNLTDYYYVVTAVDFNDLESGYSNEASATPDYQNCQDVQDANEGLVSDLSGDCYVDLWDAEKIAYYWLYTNCGDFNDCEGADFIPTDGDVDFEDFSDFAVDWMQCNNPGDPNCFDE